jgi:uncharacterized membrane protein YdbT with pleckstrin-like domain
LLGTDETVLMHMRTHGKAMFWPAVGFIGCGALLGAGAALVPYDFRPAGQVAVAIVVGVLAGWWAVIPFLRWRTTTYTLTNYRLITRTGILNKTGTNLPLARVNDVTYERSLSDRMLGCGTLRVQTAADAGPVVLRDVPDVEVVHVTMSEIIHGPYERA